VRLQDPGDRERVAGRLKHHAIARHEALGKELQSLGIALDPASRAGRASFRDRDLTEVAVNI
jgi:hypothetical protein